MPTYQLLTDRSLAQSSAITPTTLIHIVTTADTSQSVYGSSYKSSLEQLKPIFNFTGGTVSGATNFTNGLSANTMSATTYYNLPPSVFTGGTVSGPTNFTNGLTANTISATTYYNLPVTADTFTTGFTYSNNTFNIKRNQGLSDLSVTVNTFTGLTATTLSATTYQNLPTDIRVTGSTYTNNTFTSTNNTGGTYNVLFNTVTGLTVNGQLSVTGNTGLGTSSPSTRLDISSLNTTTAVNNTLRFTDTDTSVGFGTTQFNGKIEFYSNETSAVGVRSYIGGIINSTSQGSLIFGTTGTSGSLSGGTIVGERMRIDSSGNVGIGQSSPAYTLDVSSGVETADQIATRIINTSNKGLYIIPTANDSGYNFNTRSGDTVVTTTQGEHLVVGAKDGAAFRFSGGTSSSNSGNTITTGNRIGIGTVFYDSTQQPSEALDINGSARFRAVGATAFFANLNITSDGTLTTATSDIRLKENIEPLTNSLEKVLQLSGVTYSWIGQEGKKIGFIAQEVEKVIPELVFTNNNTEDKIKGIHLDNITAVLVEAIKEQQKIIEELKLRITNLES
jgi:hypothetical protein